MAKRLHQRILLLQEESENPRAVKIGPSCPLGLSQSEPRIRFILPAHGASHIMKLLKDSRMFHILWCSSGYNYFIIFISILNVLNLASNKMLLFNICYFLFYVL